MFLGCPWGSAGCAQQLCCAHQFDCPLSLFLSFGDKRKTFQLMCDRAAMTDLLPIGESFTIQGKGFLKIAELPRGMCHVALMPGDSAMISHFLVEIEHEVCMFSSLREIAMEKCQPGQQALGSYGCVRVYGTLRQGKTLLHVGLQLFCSLRSINFNRYICQSLQNIGEFLSVS